jgi:hypothetical protein
MSYDRGPRFAPAESDEPTRRIRRLEDWAGRHDQWATQTAVEERDRVVHVEERVTVLEGKVTPLFASVGDSRQPPAPAPRIRKTYSSAGIGCYCIRISTSARPACTARTVASARAPGCPTSRTPSPHEAAIV